MVKVGKLTAASCGHTEARLKALGKPYRKIYLHAGSHASYYPGAKPLHIKLLFGDDGKIYGGQVIGGEGADKRADVLAVAMRAGMTVRQLATLELCYAPPFSSAKDPMNLAGMVATNVLDGDSVVVHADALPDGALPLDVREPAELAQGALPGAVNIPLHKLRARAFELPKDRKIVIYCQAGLRGYVAERMLRQLGYDVANLSGGFLTWKQFQPEKWVPSDDAIALSAAGNEGGPKAESEEEEPKTVVDVRPLQCPGPVVRIKKEIDGLGEGATIQVLANPLFAPDLVNWAQSTGNKVVKLEQKADHICGHRAQGHGAPAGGGREREFGRDGAVQQRPRQGAGGADHRHGHGGGRDAGQHLLHLLGPERAAQESGAAGEEEPPEHDVRLHAAEGRAEIGAFQDAHGGHGHGHDEIRDGQPERASLPDMLQNARAMGVKFIACDMAMGVMGITREELVDVDEVAGVATFIARAKESGPTLFI